ncbi:MAG: 3-deoxy-manno-octulosonate cytidylyltransferase [Armatimonadetes bacterium]|nr:3-deoxy-manno-octulosonate cytidylyltransferase [Armatimonadota bacterium]MDW8122007.1 3-deoxy-manno-octulosonate cytidylyltransferase [Armatimonadota bacterium]
MRSGLSPTQRRTAVGVIPARFRSVRFEGKVLANLWGKPIVQHVYERARKAQSLTDVVVATDDERVFKTVESFGGKAKMTSPSHRSGTDRVAEVAKDLESDVIVNIQGDEPLISPQAIDAAVLPLLEDPDLEMATLATPIVDEEEYQNPNVVKVVVNQKGLALYFSRSPLPYYRVDGPGQRSPLPETPPLRPLRHIGLYAYSRDFLLRLAQWSPTPLEKAENLEQLRALEKGVAIRVVVTPYRSIGVDTPDDLARLQQMEPFQDF